MEPFLKDSFGKHFLFDGENRVLSGPTKVVTFAKRMNTNSGFICAPDLINYCGTYGGLVQLNPDVLVKQQATEIRRQAKQQNLLDNPGAVIDYYNLGFRFLIVGPQSGRWLDNAKLWIKNDQARVIYQADSFQLIELRDLDISIIK